MHVDVVFTPDEAGSAPTGIVIDVIRATSTICQALASGYSRVFCAAEIEGARSLAMYTHPDRYADAILRFLAQPGV